MPRLLSNTVELRQQFLRSVRIDADYGRTDALEGFVFQPSARLAIENLAKHINETQQRAFTWTGPYGSGKSSLALALCSLVSPEKRIRDAAKSVLGLRNGDPILSAFNASPQHGWSVLPVVGRRASVEVEVGLAIDRLCHRPKRRVKGRGRDVVAELTNLAEAPGRNGVLLLIDELGKFLESSAQTNGDIYFYQLLAEAACRSRGKLVVIGILHQAFEQYATRLGREARDEWTKVQGRFVDISLTAGSDEVIDLIGKAIDSKNIPRDETRGIASTIARSIAERRPSICTDLDERLDRCWPLHPVTAVLLGPSSRHRFGQNERSIFGFLNSVEPMGFREFLESRPLERYCYYWPWQYWDYMRANLEPAILASPEGHRWALGVEAVERTESKGKPLHVNLVKTIAVIELFRNGSGLAADNAVLASCFPDEAAGTVVAALNDLSRWSVVVFRRHLSAWGIYAGSDFDIESATAKARVEIETDGMHIIESLGDLTPVLAKRTYQETGAMRFLKRKIVRSDEVEDYLGNLQPHEKNCGELVLMMPSRDGSPKTLQAIARRLAAAYSKHGVAIGIPKEATRIAEDARELCALRHVLSTCKELESDKVAAREIDARIVALQSGVEDFLRDSFATANWYWDKGDASSAGLNSLSTIASLIAKTRFPQSPILPSELINRDAPQSNSVKARRDLMHRMISNSQEFKLGYTTYPPDAGMYISLLKDTLHQEQDDGTWAFSAPSKTKAGRSMKGFWKAAEDRLLSRGCVCRLSDLYTTWSAPPYGIKSGVLPILALAFFLANRNVLALYHDDIFVPQLTDVHVDEWLQDPSRVVLKYFEIDSSRQQFIDSLCQSLAGTIGEIPRQPLELARALVSLVVGLPEWTKRTMQLSAATKQMRQALLKATDPHRVLFVDIPAMLQGETTNALTVTISHCITELTDAYPAMLRTVQEKLFTALAHKGKLDELHERGATVSGISGDFRLDAFALRLATFTGVQDDMESLISLAVSKPSRDWTDRDVELALMQLATWAFEFRKVEILAGLRDRPSTRRAFAVVFGPAEDKPTTVRSVDIALNDIPTVNKVASEIAERAKDVDLDIFFAALAEAGAQLARSDKKE